MNITAGVCLLLWGLALLKLGMSRGFGASLRSIVAVSTNNRIKAFMAGVGVTALLQSSTATILIVTSFAAQGLIGGAAALAVVLGADVGTTLVAQVLTFDLVWLAPLMMVAGYLLFTREHSGKLKNAGRILIGLSLMLFALGWIRESAEPLKTSETLPLILAPLENDIILAVLVAAVLTWLAHSSLAIVLLMASLASSGVLPVSLALAMVLGVNLGATVPPVLATMKDEPPARRIALANVIMRASAVLVGMVFFGMAEPLILEFMGDDARGVVNFHMAFNVCLAIVFLPLAHQITILTGNLIPDRPDPDDPAQPKYLDTKALDTPSIALSGAMRETLRLADMAERMLEESLQAFKSGDERYVRMIRDQDNALDTLYHKVKIYMARVSEEFMDQKEAGRFVHILTFATNLEHVGDVIDKNLMPLASKKIRNAQNFSDEGFREIERIHSMVVGNLRLAQSVLVSNDVELAHAMLTEKDKIREAETAASTAHFERLREGVPESVATSELHMDIIRDLRRINSYICTVAYPVIEHYEEKMRRKEKLSGSDKDGEGDKNDKLRSHTE